MNWFLFLFKVVVQILPDLLVKVCRAIIDTAAAIVARAELPQKEDSCAVLHLFLLVALVVILVLTIMLMVIALTPDIITPVVDGCMSTTADLCVTGQGIAQAMAGWAYSLLPMMFVW